MKAKFINFSNGQPLEELTFRLPKSPSGAFILDAVLVNPKNRQGWDYSLEELNSLDSFVIRNKKGQPSKYSTAKGFINRLEKEL